MKDLGIRLAPKRGPVKYRDRSKKAKKIYLTIENYLRKPITGKEVLDIGCGNGEIGKVFIDTKNKVYGVDIEDVRRKNSGIKFKMVDSAKIPYKNDSFDIVISNHTIEHIPEQAEHLNEMRRIVKKTGLVYLATPNKSSPFMRGHVGNDMVLHWPEMIPLFEKHGFTVHEQSINVIKNPEKYGLNAKYAKYCPTPILKMLRRFFPSQIFILTPDK